MRLANSTCVLTVGCLLPCVFAVTAWAVGRPDAGGPPLDVVAAVCGDAGVGNPSRSGSVGCARCPTALDEERVSEVYDVDAVFPGSFSDPKATEAVVVVHTGCNHHHNEVGDLVLLRREGMAWRSVETLRGVNVSRCDSLKLSGGRDALLCRGGPPMRDGVQLMSLRSVSVVEGRLVADVLLQGGMNFARHCLGFLVYPPTIVTIERVVAPSLTARGVRQGAVRVTTTTLPFKRLDDPEPEQECLDLTAKGKSSTVEIGLVLTPTGVAIAPASQAAAKRLAATVEHL